MVFKSNSDFVFHDSCGFEAGSAEEFEKMMKFISERDRIHAIWYCIPMDDPSRTFQRSEEKFFSECDTGQVPVVAIFTKFEALRPFATVSRTGVWDRLCDAKNRARPKCHIRLENMNKPNSQSSKSHMCFPTSSRTLVERAHRLLGPIQMDYEVYQFDIAKWFPHLKVIQRLIRSDNALE
ncbi:hypothetical protein BD769DRAFT_1510791 [Suillus cothurnatus]|nr:hypothetical protein BD769DRAFT_1510791 [Suillus cothurnatus]